MGGLCAEIIYFLLQARVQLCQGFQKEFWGDTKSFYYLGDLLLDGAVGLDSWWGT